MLQFNLLLINDNRSLGNLLLKPYLNTGAKLLGGLAKTFFEKLLADEWLCLRHSLLSTHFYPIERSRGTRLIWVPQSV